MWWILFLINPIEESKVIILDRPTGMPLHIENPKRLEWVDPYGRRPKGFKQWCKENNDFEILRIGRVRSANHSKMQNLVDVVVDARIYEHLIPEINQFSADLDSEGYSVQVDTVSGMNHEALRAYLASLSGLVGAIFIGELPVAWFEHQDEEFPIDLYFMDLNGNWIDADGDWLYDDHTGDVQPEIWVGRLYARPLLWDNEINLLKQYLEKNHQYRTAGLPVAQRALTFVDDDWNFGNCSLDQVYTNVVVIDDDTATIAKRYRYELGEGYEWIQICAHSSPWGHTFLVPTGYKGTVFNYEIFVLNPHAIFYNLFACSGTRFVEENYSAGWYIFGGEYGLTVIGSAKTGSMLYFGDFYKWLGWDYNIGDAFKEWFIQWGEWSWGWFYGLNIIGDPTLKPLMAKGKRVCGSEDPHSVGGRGGSRTIPTLGWTTPEAVATHPESDGNPNILLSDGKLWIIFESGRSSGNGRSDIYSIYRDASGWSGVMNIGPHEYWDYNPVIGSPFQPIAVWAHFGDFGGNYNLRYSKYTGSSWTSPQTISLDRSWDLKPALASVLDTLWLAWQTRRDSSSDIYSAYFQANTWSSPERVTQSGEDEFAPVMVIDKDNLPWVFYCRHRPVASEIWGSYYDGSNWCEMGPISKNQKTAYRPAATADSAGRIWVGWQGFDDLMGNIYVSYFDGLNWSTPKKITFAGENNVFPSMATDTSGRAWIVWQGKVGGEWDIYAAYSDGILWSAPEVINLVGADINPKVASDSSGIWVTWQNYQDNWDIYVSRRDFVGVEEEMENPKSDSELVSVPTLEIWPNPFTTKTVITVCGLSTKVTADFSLRIYDLTGRVVKSFPTIQLLDYPPLKQIQGKVLWDGRDNLGEKVSSSVYFLKFEAGKYNATRKLLKIMY